MNAGAARAIGVGPAALVSIALVASAFAACGGSTTTDGHGTGGYGGFSSSPPVGVGGVGGASGATAIEDWCNSLCQSVGVCPDPVIGIDECVDECVSWGSPFECPTLRLRLKLCARATLEECGDLSGCDHVVEEIDNCRAQPEECAPVQMSGFGRPGVQASLTRMACACAGSGGREPGEPCAAADVCGSVCCGCDEPGAEVTVQVCLAGRCAGPAVACDIALANAPDACE